MTPLELKVNLKIRVRSEETGDPGFVMVVHRIEGDKITCMARHFGPLGGSWSRFVFYRSGDYYSDGKGLRLIVEKFRRTP